MGNKVAVSWTSLSMYYEKMKNANCLILNLYLIVSRHGSRPGHCCLKNKLGNSIKVLSKDTS